MDTAPRLSVLVPALGRGHGIEGMLKALRAQTARRLLEIIVLTRSQQTFAEVDQVVVTGSLHLHEARALGVQKARGEFVVLAEDHCFPDPGWAQALLERLDEGWDAVGPSMRSGNPGSLWAQAAFLLGYGEWIFPTRAHCLPGHNAAVRRALLFGRANLDQELLVGSLLMRSLQQQGAQFCTEERASMAHWDCTGPLWSLLTFCAVGSGFGAQRTQGWSVLRRLLYALAGPMVALLHWKRGCRHLLRVHPKMSWLAAGPAVLLAAAWALGEAAGSFLGMKAVAGWVAYGEVGRLDHVADSFHPPK